MPTELSLGAPVLAALLSVPAPLAPVLLGCLVAFTRCRQPLPYLSIGASLGVISFQALFWGPYLAHRLTSTALLGVTPLTLWSVPSLLAVVIGLLGGWFTFTVVGLWRTVRDHRDLSA